MLERRSRFMLGLYGLAGVRTVWNCSTDGQGSLVTGLGHGSRGEIRTIINPSRERHTITSKLEGFLKPHDSKPVTLFRVSLESNVTLLTAFQSWTRKMVYTRAQSACRTDKGDARAPRTLV